MPAYDRWRPSSLSVAVDAGAHQTPGEIGRQQQMINPQARATMANLTEATSPGPVFSASERNMAVPATFEARDNDCSLIGQLVRRQVIEFLPVVTYDLIRPCMLSQRRDPAVMPLHPPDPPQIHRLILLVRGQAPANARVDR